jgi:hypothetical protein
MIPNKFQVLEYSDGWSAVEAGDSQPGRRRYLYGRKLRGYYVEVVHQPDEEFWKFSWELHRGPLMLPIRGGLKDGEVLDVLNHMVLFIDTIREFRLLPPSDEELDGAKT